jgi:hypothetical protein
VITNNELSDEDRSESLSQVSQSDSRPDQSRQAQSLRQVQSLRSSKSSHVSGKASGRVELEGQSTCEFPGGVPLASPGLAWVWGSKLVRSRYYQSRAEQSRAKQSKTMEEKSRPSPVSPVPRRAEGKEEGGTIFFFSFSLFQVCPTRFLLADWFWALHYSGRAGRLVAV